MAQITKNKKYNNKKQNTIEPTMSKYKQYTKYKIPQYKNTKNSKTQQVQQYKTYIQIKYNNTNQK